MSGARTGYGRQESACLSQIRTLDPSSPWRLQVALWAEGGQCLLEGCQVGEDEGVCLSNRDGRTGEEEPGA